MADAFLVEAGEEALVPIYKTTAFEIYKIQADKQSGLESPDSGLERTTLRAAMVSSREMLALHRYQCQIIRDALP